MSETPERDAVEPIWIRTHDAALVHQVSERTIRKWLDKADPRVVGEKMNGVWMVRSSRDEVTAAGLVLAEDGTIASDAPAGSLATLRDPERVDLAPLAETIESIVRMHAAERRDLEERIARLSATAAMWQERAEGYERQLAAQVEADPGPAPAPAPRSWWDRLLGR